MAKPTNPLTVVIAEDNRHEWELAYRGLTHAGLANTVHHVTSGEALMGYLTLRLAILRFPPAIIR